MPRCCGWARPLAGDADWCGQVTLLSVACDRAAWDGAGDFAADRADGRPGSEARFAGAARSANSLRFGSRNVAAGLR